MGVAPFDCISIYSYFSVPLGIVKAGLFPLKPGGGGGGGPLRPPDPNIEAPPPLRCRGRAVHRFRLSLVVIRWVSVVPAREVLADRIYIGVKSPDGLIRRTEKLRNLFFATGV